MVNVPYISRTRIDGEWVPIENYSRDFTVTAPDAVRPGEEFTVRFASAPILAVAAFNRQLTDLRVAYRVTGAGTVVTYRLEGGSNTDGARFWWSAPRPRPALGRPARREVYRAVVGWGIRRASRATSSVLPADMRCRIWSQTSSRG